MVNHAAAVRGVALPRLGGALSPRRRLAGFALSLVAGPLLTRMLAAERSPEALVADVLAYRLLVVVVALAGGIWPALYTAVMSAVTLDLLFIEPVLQIRIDHPVHLGALVLYALNAVLVSYVVDQAARRTRTAQRAGAEFELLATVAGSVLRGQDALRALVGRTREAFALDAVRLRSDGAVLSSAGEAPPGAEPTVVAVGERASLELHGATLGASERRLLEVIATQIDAALEHQDLRATASEVGPLAENDQVRSALLSAVSHDLRRPLAAVTTAVSSLRLSGVDWSPGDRDELLATAEESLATLTALLDVSRLQAGVLAVSARDTDVDEVILPALDELGLGPADVDLELDPDLPAVRADAGLLQRAIVDLLANAVRFSPPGRGARVATGAFGAAAQIRVIDHGPGVSPDRLDQLFVPFQRLGDTDNTTGLGLALSRGFVEGMGGRLTAEDTPGGGLTMVISLPLAERPDPRRLRAHRLRGQGPGARRGRRRLRHQTLRHRRVPGAGAGPDPPRRGRRRRTARQVGGADRGPVGQDRDPRGRLGDGGRTADPHRVAHPGDPRAPRREARHTPEAAGGRVGVRARHRHRLPAPVRLPAAQEARTRPQGAAVPHHRARYGVPFPAPRMTSAVRVVHRCVERPWTRGTGHPSRGGRATGHAAEEGSENDGFRGT
jgi:two-component system sensor histidine kinase KdpD